MPEILAVEQVGGQAVTRERKLPGQPLQARLSPGGRTPEPAAARCIIDGNILTDENGHRLAVLDFGFLTTAADPQFDAAVAANITSMYAPPFLTIARQLTARVAAVLRYQPEMLRTYQAAYAVATGNAFSADGTDGHFDWCIAQLWRADVLSALGI